MRKAIIGLGLVAVLAAALGCGGGSTAGGSATPPEGVDTKAKSQEYMKNRGPG